MTDLVAEFQRRMQQVASSGESGGTELLLELMGLSRAREFRLCAIPHQFDVEIFLALVPGVTADEARRRCEELSPLSLVIPAPEGLSVHESVRRNMFRQWLEPENREEFAAASTRLVELFDDRITRLQGDRLETARRRRMFHLLGADPEQGFAEFERLSRAARHGLLFGECGSLIRLVHEYDAVLPQKHALWLLYYEARLASDLRNWQEAELKFKQVLDAPNAPPELKVASYRRLSYVLSERRDWNGAIGLCQQAMELAESTPAAKHMLPRIVLDLGAAYRESNDLERSEELLRKSADLAAASNNLSCLAAARNSLGLLHLTRRDTQLAIAAFESSLEALTRNNEVFRTAQVYNNLGLAFANMPDWPSSEQYFRKSLEIKAQAGDTLGQANALGNLARAQAGQGKLQEATQSAERAIELFQQMRDHYATAVARHNLGRLYRRMQQKELAAKQLREASEMFNSLGKPTEAQAAAADLEAIDRKPGLPWWAWAAIGICAMLVILAVIVLMS